MFPQTSTSPPSATILSRLRAKGLIAKVARSRRYRLLAQGYSICLVFLKLFERIYAPLAAGLLNPVKGDARLPLVCTPSANDSRNERPET